MMKQFLPWLSSKQLALHLAYNGVESGESFYFCIETNLQPLILGEINLQLKEKESKFDAYCRQFLPWVEAKLELEWPKGDIELLRR
jgi:hypothetical protein